MDLPIICVLHFVVVEPFCRATGNWTWNSGGGSHDTHAPDLKIEGIEVLGDEKHGVIVATRLSIGSSQSNTS